MSRIVRACDWTDLCSGRRSTDGNITNWDKNKSQEQVLLDKLKQKDGINNKRAVNETKQKTTNHFRKLYF